MYASLEASLLLLFTGNEKVSASTLYQSVFDICTCTPESFAVELYDKLKLFLTDRVNSIFSVFEYSKYQTIQSSQQVSVNYSMNWKKYSESAGHMNYVCDYLNRLLTKYNLSSYQDEHEPRRFEPTDGQEFMNIYQVITIK